MMVREVYDKADQAAEGALLRLFSRWASMVLVPISIGGAAWIGTTIWGFNTTLTAQGVTQAATMEKLAETNRQLSLLAQRLENLVPRQEIEFRFADQDRRIQSNTSRVERLEADALAGRPVRR